MSTTGRAQLPSGPADPLALALERHFGWSDFRPGQRPVVEALLAGQDCLAVLPTGGGKSLCYQLPALVRGGLVLVISPLVALMQDQVSQLQRRGIPAACLHGGLALPERRQLLQRLRDHRLRLLYLAPERLQGKPPASCSTTFWRAASWWRLRWTRPTASAPGAMISAPTTAA